MMQVDRVSWWEPYGETRRLMLAELRETGLLRPLVWVRMIGLSALIVGLVVAWVLWANPGIVLPWGRLSAGLAVGPMSIAFLLALTMFFPRHAEVRRDWIQITHGQSASRVKADRIRRIELLGSWPDEQRLIVEYTTPRGRPMTLECGVRTSVNQEVLKALVSFLAAGAVERASKP